MFKKGGKFFADYYAGAKRIRKSFITAKAAREHEKQQRKNQQRPRSQNS